jgi:hypothetical protein
MVLEKDGREGKGTCSRTCLLSFFIKFSLLPFSTLESHLRKIKIVLEKDGREGKDTELVPEHVYFLSSSTFPFFLFQLWNVIFIKSKWFWSAAKLWYDKVVPLSDNSTENDILDFFISNQFTLSSLSFQMFPNTSSESISFRFI